MDEERTLAAELSRRHFLARAGTLGVGAMIAAALPVAARVAIPEHTAAQLAAPVEEPVGLVDGTMQAYFDTIIPGRRATSTDLGQPIHPLAIAAVDPEPGAVEADALLLSHHELIGFDTLAPALFAELQARSAPLGGDFINLDYRHRERVCAQGLDFSNPTQVVWAAGAAVPYTAFCAAATQRNATKRTASGYRVMGHPGTARRGYRDFSYRRKLARERTRRGYLP